MRFLSLFSGIGLHGLGLTCAGIEVVGQVEFDDFCTEVLEKHWPGLPRWKDVRDVRVEDVVARCGRVDGITGGFACQDVSAAGKGAGIGKTTRSGITWRNLFRLARGGSDGSKWGKGGRPRWLVIENVPALRGRGADRVLRALERIGYACWPLVVGARHLGAPHKRDRVWIVCRLADAPRNGERREPETQRPIGERAGFSGWTNRTAELDDAELARRDARGGDARDEEGAWRGRGEPRQPDTEALAYADDDGLRAICAAYDNHGRHEPGHDADGRGASVADAEGGGLGAVRPARRPSSADADGNGANGLADANGAAIWDEQQRLSRGRSGGVRDEGQAEPEGDGTAGGMADASSERVEGLRANGQRLPAVPAGPEVLGCDGDRGGEQTTFLHGWPSRPGEPQYEWEPPRLVPGIKQLQAQGGAQSGLGGDADGRPVRLVSLARRESLKALGNANPPQCAELIGRAVVALERSGL